MAEERKIRCDCGAYFEERDTLVENVRVKGLICGGCCYRTFTKEQMKYIIELMRLHKIVGKKKKIIRIGNSIGITLPQGLNANVGDAAVMEVVSPDWFLIKIRRAAKN